MDPNTVWEGTSLYYSQVTLSKQVLGSIGIVNYPKNNPKWIQMLGLWHWVSRPKRPGACAITYAGAQSAMTVLAWWWLCWDMIIWYIWLVYILNHLIIVYIFIHFKYIIIDVLDDRSIGYLMYTLQDKSRMRCKSWWRCKHQPEEGDVGRRRCTGCLHWTMFDSGKRLHTMETHHVSMG